MAKQSLASKGKGGDLAVFNGGGALAVFDDPGRDMVEGGGNVYAAFASQKSEKFPDLVAQVPGLKDGDVVLFNHGDKPLKIDSLKISYVAGEQFWAAIDSQGKPLAASLTRKQGDFKPNVRWQEVVETLVLIHLGDEIVPATMAFKAGRAKAAVKCKKERDKAATPEWAGQSAAHKVAAKMPKPALRFVATISGGKQTSKSTGNAYGVADAVITPVGTGEIAALSAVWPTEDFQAALNAAMDNYKARVAELSALASK